MIVLCFPGWQFHNVRKEKKFNCLLYSGILFYLRPTGWTSLLLKGHEPVLTYEANTRRPGIFLKPHRLSSINFWPLLPAWSDGFVTVWISMVTYIHLPGMGMKKMPKSLMISKKKDFALNGKVPQGTIPGIQDVSLTGNRRNGAGDYRFHKWKGSRWSQKALGQSDQNLRQETGG